MEFYSDSSLDKDAIMSHILTSEKGMPVSRLMRLEKTENGILFQVRWKGLPTTKDMLEPIQRVHEDGPAMLQNMSNRKNTKILVLSLIHI